MHYPLALGHQARDRQSAMCGEAAQDRSILEPGTEQTSAAPSTSAILLARIRAVRAGRRARLGAGERRA